MSERRIFNLGVPAEDMDKWRASSEEMGMSLTAWINAACTFYLESVREARDEIRRLEQEQQHALERAGRDRRRSLEFRPPVV